MWCYSYFKDTPQAPPLVGPQWEMENLCLSLWHLDLHLNPDKGLAIKHSLYTKSRGRLYRRGSCCGAKHLAGLSFNAHCRDVSVFNVKVINNAKGRARPVAVKGQGGVGKTKYIFFSPFYCMAAPSELAVLLTAPDSGGFMWRSKWKWPVTFPVVLASSQTARHWTASTMSRSSLSLISSYLMLFPRCGHLLTERPGACVSVHVFPPLLRIFFLSQLKMSAVCCTKQPSMVFWIPPGSTEVIGQPVTQSVGNVCFVLLAECGKLFTEAAEQHSA